jgi:hypothetical protein
MRIACRGWWAGKAGPAVSYRETKKPPRDQRSRWFPVTPGAPSDLSKSAEVRLAESDGIAVAYEIRTESAKSRALEKNGRRERISGLDRCVAVERFTRESPCLLGILALSQPGRECSARIDWRRETSATSNILRFEHTATGDVSRVGNRVPAGHVPGRTLWCQGAPTRTCCGATQGVKLRGQCRRLCQPQGGARLGETWKAERKVKTRWARHSEAAKEADRPQPKGNVERTVGPVSAGGGARMFHRVVESSLPTTHLEPDQLGKPHGPHLWW